MQKCETNLLWVDIAKVMGIFLVIFAHCITGGMCIFQNFFETRNLYLFIYLFHMPLFFVISGYLYKKYTFKSNLKKITLGLLVPYFIYQITYFPFIVGQRIFYNHLDCFSIIYKTLLGIFLGDVQTGTHFLSCCIPCWFIVVIIQMRFLFALFKESKKLYIILSIISLSLLEFLRYFKMDLYFCLDCTLMAIPYFVFGYLLKNCDFGIEKNNVNIFKSIVFAALLILLLVYIYKINGTILISEVILNIGLTQSILLSYFSGILGFFLIYNLSRMININNHFIQTISKNTLFVIFFHYLVFFIGRWIGIHKYSTIIYDTIGIFGLLIVTLLYSMFNLLINYYVILFLSKFFPIVLGKYKK